MFLSFLSQTGLHGISTIYNMLTKLFTSKMSYLSPPAVHMSVPHLAGSRHQGNFGPNSRQPFTQHNGQHLHFCLCGSWNFPHHQWPGTGDHPQRQCSPVEETGGHGTHQSGCAAAHQGQPAYTRHLMDSSWGRHSRLTKRLLTLRYRSKAVAGPVCEATGGNRWSQWCWGTTMNQWESSVSLLPCLGRVCTFWVLWKSHTEDKKNAQKRAVVHFWAKFKLLMISRFKTKQTKKEKQKEVLSFQDLLLAGWISAASLQPIQAY